MKRGLLTARLLGIAWTGFAQSQPTLEAPAEQGAGTPAENWVFSLGQIDFGAQLTDTDTNSSKFREYRDVRNGVVFPYFRLFGQTKATRFDLSAEHIGQRDGRYRLMAELEPVRVKVDYNLIPHRFGNDARTLLHEAAQDRLVIDDTIQRANQTAIETNLKGR